MNPWFTLGSMNKGTGLSLRFLQVKFNDQNYTLEVKVTAENIAKMVDAFKSALL